MNNFEQKKKLANIFAIKKNNFELNCTVQTVLNFWQNDETRLRAVVLNNFDLPIADHITHFEGARLRLLLKTTAFADFGDIVTP